MPGELNLGIASMNVDDLADVVLQHIIIHEGWGRRCVLLPQVIAVLTAQITSCANGLHLNGIMAEVVTAGHYWWV